VLRILAGLLCQRRVSLRSTESPSATCASTSPGRPKCAPGVPEPRPLLVRSRGQNVGFLLYRHARLPEIAEDSRQGFRRPFEAVGPARHRRPANPEAQRRHAENGELRLGPWIDRPASRLASTPLLLFDEPDRRPRSGGLHPASRMLDRHHQPAWRGAASVVVSHVMRASDPALPPSGWRCSRRPTCSGAGANWRSSSKTAILMVAQFRSGSLQGPMQPTEL